MTAYHTVRTRVCLALTAGLFVALIAVPAMAVDKVSTQTGDWEDTNTWGGTGAPGSGDDVFVASTHTVTINGLSTISINSLSVSGVLDHADASTTESDKIILDITTDCTIEVGGRIDVTDKGYNNGQGPGKPGVSNGSGSHGGRGRGNHATAYGDTYGSIIAPTNYGSGGGSTEGGGAVIMTVGGETKLHGYIQANSGAGGSWQYPGAGGSVYLTTDSLSGSGTIEARSRGSHFTGGGGRIAVVLTGSDSFGSIDTITYASQNVSADGMCGTVYLEKQSDTAGQGELVINQGGFAVGGRDYLFTTMSDTEAVSYQFSRMTATNRGTITVGSDDTLNLTGATVGGDTDGTAGVLVDGGTLTVGSTWTLSDFTVTIRDGSTFDVSSALTVASGGTLAIDAPHTISGDVTVQDGGQLTHSANDTTEDYKMDLTIGGELQVDAGGAVNVDNKGYSSADGPGWAGQYNAGHGGDGAYGGKGFAYGSIVSPTNIGSGGQTYPGGGAAILTVTKETRLYGYMTAGAPNAGSWQYVGSGGSVFLTTSNLVGTGTIQATSGLPGGHMSGGGGRIAVHLTGPGSSFGSVEMTAKSEDSTSDGGAGTVYKRTASQGWNEGTLIIDQPHNSSAYTSIRPEVRDASVGDVIIRNNGELLLTTNQLLQVSGSWSNDNVFVAQAGSRVEFVGTDTVTVFGSSTFEELVCTGVTKQINFEEGETTTVNDYFIFGGPSDTSLVLRSTSGAGVQWILDVDAGATEVSVSYVDVKDSDALPGQDVTASTSLDTGNNDGWVFAAVGETNWWTGGTSANWADNGNWSLNRPPAGIDGGTIISNNCSYYPSLPSATVLAYFEMKNPSSLSLGGFDLTVNDDAVIAGTLAATGTETLTFKGDADFTSGTFTQAQSTVVLAGTGAQSMTSAGESCYRLTVTNSGRTVTFADAASATYFRNESVSLEFDGGVTATEFKAYTTDGSITQEFAAASTSTITDLFLLGAAGKTNWLVSSSGGTKWNLDVDRIAYVKHANVEDSDADLGVTIYPIDSTDTGSNNDNWVFTETWLTWDGSDSDAFATPANWTPPTAPDATARVNIDGNGGNAPVVSSAISVKDVLLGGDQASTLTLNDSLTVGENVRVMGLGTLVASKPSTVSNDLTVLDGGTLTHGENTSTEDYKINLTVGGDFYLGSDAEIDVDLKGYASGGPGYGPYAWGASHGGQGGAGTGPAKDTYGSVLAPTNCGSSGQNTYDGGGVVQLAVSGETKLYGYVHANGESVSGYSSAGAGGSIYLTTSTLVGSGTLEAEGGTSQSYGGAGGGRISVVLTTGTSFDQVTMKVRGGNGGGSTTAGANGTIYKQIGTDADGAGTVIVDCDGRAPDSSGYDSATVLLPDTLYVADELANATLIVTNDNTHLKLTNANVYVSELLIYTNTTVTLGALELHVDVVEHHLDDADTAGPGGPTNAVDNYSQIIWKIPPPGLNLIFK